MNFQSGHLKKLPGEKPGLLKYSYLKTTYSWGGAWGRAVFETWLFENFKFHCNKIFFCANIVVITVTIKFFVKPGSVHNVHITDIHSKSIA